MIYIRDTLFWSGTLENFLPFLHHLKVQASKIILKMNTISTLSKLMAGLSVHNRRHMTQLLHVVCMNLLLAVLHVICTWLCFGSMNIPAGDRSQHSEEIVKSKKKSWTAIMLKVKKNLELQLLIFFFLLLSFSAADLVPWVYKLRAQKRKANQSSSLIAALPIMAWHYKSTTFLEDYWRHFAHTNATEREIYIIHQILTVHTMGWTPCSTCNRLRENGGGQKFILAHYSYRFPNVENVICGSEL